MLKKDVRSRNVYENKQISDTMPGRKSDIYVLDSDILYKQSPILQKPTLFWSLFDRWEPNCSLQNVQTRGPRRPARVVPRMERHGQNDHATT